MLIDYKALGDRVHKLRRTLGITQVELANQIGITASFYGHIEHGTRVPSCETIYRLARTLNCSSDYLLGLTSDNLSDGLLTTLTDEQRRVALAAVEAIAHALSQNDHDRS